jgi:hypothetical protein
LLLIYDDMGLQQVADVCSFAYERGPSEIRYFLRHAVLDDEPDEVAGNSGALAAVGEGGYGDGGGGIY